MSEELGDLIYHLKGLVASNLKTMQHTDAIFFAEKQLHLCHKRLTQIEYVLSSDELNEFRLHDLNETVPPFIDIEQMTNFQRYTYEKHFCKTQFDQSVYDLAFSFMQNKEYMRCINIIEKHELVYRHEKFRILVAQAQI
jgi:hypothetical protein